MNPVNLASIQILADRDNNPDNPKYKQKTFEIIPISYNLIFHN